MSLVQLFYETYRTTIDSRQGVIIERDGKEKKEEDEERERK